MRRCWRKRGAGFGLYNVRERMEAEDGWLELESTPGEGTTARLKCPVKLIAGDESSSRPQEPSRVTEEGSDSLQGDKLRVLVVDDHTIMREGLVDLLETESDIEVAGEAEDGAEAMEKGRELNPDVVLMDIAMPGMNGIEATRRLTELMPEVRVIALSLHDDEELVRDILDAGAEAYVHKGQTSEQLLDAVRASPDNPDPVEQDQQ